MAASSDSKNERNFLQLHRLVLDSTRVLRAKFDSFVPSGTTLQAWLQTKDLSKTKLNKEQIASIMSQTTSEKFDITALTSLLRSFCYKANDPLWFEKNNNNLSPSQTGAIADIVRIRNQRNEVCMKHSMSKIHCTSPTKRGIYKRVYHSMCKWGPVLQFKLASEMAAWFCRSRQKHQVKPNFIFILTIEKVA